MKFKHSLVFITLFLIGISKIYSQPCTILGQTPATAFPVCGTSSFIQNSVPLCGNVNIPGPCGISGYTDKNPFWYRFTCYSAGTLGFQITPNVLSDDYDWQLFDITGRNPNDVFTDATLFVACNWSGLSGITGASAAGTSLVNCGGNAYPLMSRMPALILNHEYILLVSHYTDTQSGYQLSFTGGTAVITDPVPPKVNNATANCDGTQIIVRLNKKMKCTSLASNGSDFTITPSGTIATVSGYGCSNGFDMDSVLITMAAPLAAGNYTITMADGNDGNTLLDNCGTPVPVGFNVQFTITAQQPLPMGTVTQPGCAPTSLTLTFAEPIKCNTVAANGTDFTITGPSTVTVSGATAVNCSGNGETNTITIQLSSPITVGGNYQVNAAIGTDGTTLVGNCSRQVTAGANAAFTVAAQSPVAMGTVTPPSCTPSSITLTFAEAIQCSSVATNGSDFTITGPSAVAISSATAVNCNAAGETTTITLQLAGPVLSTGTYQVQVNNGSDGNTLIGNCNRQVTAGDNTSFVLAPQPAIAMGTVSPPPCTPQTITLTFADPILCNSVAANGTDFIITGPSAVTVSSATAINCNGNGETNSITIQFSTPILVTGNYTVQIATGTDGNTLVGQCNRRVSAGSSSLFTLAAQPPLPLGTIATPSCSPSSVTINFTDPVDCLSISADGSEFNVTGPSGVTVTGAAGQCNINPNVHAITVQFASPIIVSGTYQLQVKAGTDGNTLRGDCNRYVAVGDFKRFVIPDAFPVAMDSIIPVACSPSTLKLLFKSPIRCSSIAPNGSDFVITGPATVAVASATGTCDANGLTTSINVQLASPIVVGGNYQLRLVTGSDGNTLLSDCNRETLVNSTLNFITSDTVSAEFQYQVQYDCQTDVITFAHDGQHNVNQWTWTVNGTAAGTTQTITRSFSAFSQNQVQLVVSNGMCNDTYTASVNLDNKVTVEFDLPESVCPGDSVLFINRTKGHVDSWQWDFGNSNTSTVKDPPMQVYPTTGTETLYPISLTAANNLGCQASATRTLRVLSSCIIAVPSAFTPNNDGLNDYLFPLNALKAENLDFKVFNRWGQLIFHSRDWRQKWDGTVGGIKQGTGVYIWMLDFTDKDTHKKFSMKGMSTLIR
ncbi:MAG: T9SS type B sorting domain-containing protein [Bacteroidetes bacterium]|nr:MAG: T9SS type B sorting domain-containing protein [Bacteroidota bacterium]